MTQHSAPRFDIALSDLERSAHVPPPEQIEEVQDSEPHPSAWAWDEERRQARLAGGA